MIYQSSTGKLYLLLSACAPENERVQARLFDEEIRQSDAYRILSSDVQGKRILHQILQDSTKKLTASIKAERLKCMSLSVKLLEQLPKALQNQDVAELTCKDLPDFCSADSLSRLLKKIEGLPRGGSCTNLTQSNSLMLFEQETLRSSRTVLPELTPSQLDHIMYVLPLHLAGKPFCVSSTVLQEEITDLQGVLEESTAHLTLARRDRHNRRVLKCALLVAVLSLAFCLMLLHLLPRQETALFTVCAAGATILMMIVG